MKKILALSIALWTTWVGTLFAGQDVCCDQTYCGAFTVYADYLYWHVCETGIAVVDTNGERTDVSPDYQSGWRVGGRYSFACWDVGLRFTDFSASSSKTVSEPQFLRDGVATFDFDWKVLDLEFGYVFWGVRERLQLRPFVGVKFLWVEESVVDPTSSPGGVRETSHEYHGCGLLFGAEGRFLICARPLCGRLFEASFLTRGSYAIVEGDDRAALLRTTLFFEENRDCLFRSLFEVFAGLDLSYSCSSCFVPHLMLGWESNNVPRWENIIADTVTPSLGLGGLVVRVLADF